MKRSILDGKRILAVDDEPDVLALLEEEIGDPARTAPSKRRERLRGPSRNLSPALTTSLSWISWGSRVLICSRSP